MTDLKQSTAYTRMFLMLDSSDHITGKTGLAVTVTLSKAGAAFGAASGSVSQVSSGWYKIVLDAADVDTLGDLAYHCTAAGADPTDFVDRVTANLLDDIPTAAQNAAGLLDLVNGIETGVTVRQGFRIWLAALAGKVNGATTATMHFRDQADGKNRITATVDTDGNRTAVTLDAS